MLPGLNPKDMARLMRQLGIQQEDLSVASVVITLTTGERLVFTQPSLVKIRMQGQEVYQLIGTPEHLPAEEAPLTIRDEDVQTVMEQAGVTAEEARRALEEAEGDLAAAILKLEEQDA